MGRLSQLLLLALLAFPAALLLGGSRGGPGEAGRSLLPGGAVTAAEGRRRRAPGERENRLPPGLGSPAPPSPPCR